MNSLNIVFAGTPEFGLPCLEAIDASPHKIKAIYTQPDRPAGRGRQMQASAVKVWAQAHKLSVYQPYNFKDAQTVEELRALAPDVIVVIAYGLILPRAVLEIPRLGCINVHASLLPRWRGASPIQHAILRGDQRTGVTIMQMDVGMDTGDMLLKSECSIYPDDNASRLHERLSQLAPEALLETLNNIANENISPESQIDSLATHAPKINKIDALIQWENPASVIDQQIRAFNPWPIAYTQVGDQIMRIHQAHIISTPVSKAPGTVLSMDKEGIVIATGANDKALCIDYLQFPGSKIISATDWLNAPRRTLQVGMIL